MTSWVYPPRLERNPALAMVSRDMANTSTEMRLNSDAGEREARTVAMPLVDPERILSRA